MLKEQCEEEECFHISTDMCKSHRDKTLKEINYRLKQNLPCRLISTSCIESGVDLDFEYMYRALAPLDSIIQCAGRCNRNGINAGKMVVFCPNEKKLYPSDSYQNAANCVQVISKRHKIDINNPSHIEEYYTEIFTQFDKDKKKLCDAINDYDFFEIDKQYKFIPSSGVNVLVPYEDEIELFEQLADEAIKQGISKSWIKRAASITVTSYRKDKLEEICEKCVIKTAGHSVILSDWYILNDKRFYNDYTGLHFDDDSSLDYLV